MVSPVYLRATVLLSITNQRHVIILDKSIHDQTLAVARPYWWHAEVQTHPRRAEEIAHGRRMRVLQRRRRKHRYVGIYGDRRIKRMLRSALRWEVFPYPKREQLRDALSELGTSETLQPTGSTVSFQFHERINRNYRLSHSAARRLWDLLPVVRNMSTMPVLPDRSR